MKLTYIPGNRVQLVLEPATKGTVHRTYREHGSLWCHVVNWDDGTTTTCVTEALQPEATP